MVTSLWTAQTLYLFGFTLAYGMSSTWTSEGNNWFIEKNRNSIFIVYSVSGVPKYFVAYSNV